MAILSKLMYRSNVTIIKIQAGLLFFLETGKLSLKFIWKSKPTKIDKIILKKMNQVGRLTLLNFKTYYKAPVIKAVQQWYKDRNIDQRNRIKSSEINPIFVVS